MFSDLVQANYWNNVSLQKPIFKKRQKIIPQENKRSHQNYGISHWKCSQPHHQHNMVCDSRPPSCKLLTCQLENLLRRLNHHSGKGERSRVWYEHSGSLLEDALGKWGTAPIHHSGIQALLIVMQETEVPWVGKIPWRKEWHQTPIFLLRELCG